MVRKMDYIAFGKRIRQERLKLNLTQERLAEDVDLSAAYIGQIERGERSVTLGTLVLIVNRLGVTVDYLLSNAAAYQNTVSENLMLQFLNDRSEDEKMLAVNLIKLLFSYLDEDKNRLKPS